MGLWRPGKHSNRQTEGMRAAMGKLMEEMAKAGVMVLTGGWDPNGPCTVITNERGKIAITDGPFTEAKEAIGGFALLEVKSKEEAIEWVKKFMTIAGEGVSEVRELGH